jgi:iron(III) transport system ATP-binding protein
MKIELHDIQKSYGLVPVLQGVSLTIETNEFFFLLGPSGCGKTTLLRILAGFVAPDRGNILFDGERVNDLPPEKRGTPMVFQNYALWPHLTVFENVAYGLRVRRQSESEINQRTHEALETTQIQALAQRFPGQLSGGQQQRVAISRALAVNPAVLFFDEPLSNLDAQLRKEMRSELLAIHRDRPFTGVYVTHDQEEAMTMASRIAVMERGRVLQVGSAQQLYTRPHSRFVAEFMGSINWIPARVRHSPSGESLPLETPLGDFLVAELPSSATPEKELLLGFRPSAVNLNTTVAAKTNRILCEVLETQYVGSYQQLTVLARGALNRSEQFRFKLIEPNPLQLRRNGDHLKVDVAPEQIIVLAN